MPEARGGKGEESESCRMKKTRVLHGLWELFIIKVVKLNMFMLFSNGMCQVSICIHVHVCGLHLYMVMVDLVTWC